jgi:pimeloyl-ACP methyl ester carboxylesterase
MKANVIVLLSHPLKADRTPVGRADAMWFFVILCALAAAFALGFSIHVSNVVRRGAFEPTVAVPAFDLEILGGDTERISIRPLDPGGSVKLRQTGVWGLRWDGGHGRLEDVLEEHETHVVRRWAAFGPPPEPGTPARIDRGAFPDDTKAAFEMRFEPVRYPSPIGEFSGALWRGTNRTWALFVHGKRSRNPGPLPHAYPILPVAAALGLSCLDVPYRNDPEAPRSDGLHWYGLREWKDLEAAARFAIESGAERLLLVGYSMGGAIALSFMARSALASRVAGLVLDAPVLDLRAAIELGIRRRGIPPWVVGPGLWLAARRLGVGWESFDRFRDVAGLEAPILLAHGDRDPVVPIGGSERLWRLRPDLVTFLPVPGAAHAYAWNVDPERYEAALRTFFESVLGSSPGAAARPYERT